MKQFNRFRLFGLLCLFGLFSLFATAQPPGGWTADMPSSKIPTGVTLADADTLTGTVVKRRFDITLDATTYDNATQATAFNAIGAATKTAVLGAWCTSQAIDTADISLMSVVIKNINREFDTYDYPDPLLQYEVAEDIYRVTGIFKYKL